MTNRTLKKHLTYKLPQLRLALIREGEAEPVPIRVPDDIEPFVEPLRHFSEEYFIAYHLDALHHVVGYHEVSHGTASASLVHPREVFKAAILSNSHSLIVAHNHPAGSTNPSDEDLQTTAQLVNAGKLLGISVVDHIIVTRKHIASIREQYPRLFE